MDEYQTETINSLWSFALFCQTDRFGTGTNHPVTICGVFQTDDRAAFFELESPDYARNQVVPDSWEFPWLGGGNMIVNDTEYLQWASDDAPWDIGFGVI